MRLKALAPNFHLLNFGRVTLWFSYETLVAYRVDGQQMRVLDYKGSRTTSKHLNTLDGGVRLAAAEFQRLLEKEVRIP